ncbi:MAG: class II fructose-bisphosphate aldolase [Candidatus Colwellbacteria bacterium]|nr:class II fructose-bisphosphate aldolase [Candidatus Colwellbacteria bacterium]
MKNLREIIAEAEKKKVAIGHFNVSELAAFRAVTKAARDLGVPVIIGTSEGERDFIDIHDAVAMVRDLREKHGQPVFLNADHTHSIEKVKEAVEAGYDAILFDGAALPFEENIQKTREVVTYVKKMAPQILVEAEIGNIGSGSTIRKELPHGAAINPEDLTTPEEAVRFVKGTEIDLLAPAVGNIHGMFANAPEPALDNQRIKLIREALRQAQGKPVPLVLHGASGNTDEELKTAITAGISIIHISTEIRVAWRKGVEKSLEEKPDEVTPYKLLSGAENKIYEIVLARLKLFSGR